MNILQEADAAPKALAPLAKTALDANIAIRMVELVAFAEDKFET